MAKFLDTFLHRTTMSSRWHFRLAGRSMTYDTYTEGCQCERIEHILLRELG